MGVRRPPMPQQPVLPDKLQGQLWMCGAGGSDEIGKTKKYSPTLHEEVLISNLALISFLSIKARAIETLPALTAKTNGNRGSFLRQLWSKSVSKVESGQLDIARSGLVLAPASLRERLAGPFNCDSGRPGPSGVKSSHARHY